MSDLNEAREQKVRELAYRLWNEAGRPFGREEEFWMSAQQRLKAEEPSGPNDDLDMAGEHSFPASDPVNNT